MDGHGPNHIGGNREPNHDAERLNHGMSGVVLRSDRHNASVGTATLTRVVGTPQEMSRSTTVATRSSALARGGESAWTPGRGTTTVTMTAEGASLPGQGQQAPTSTSDAHANTPVGESVLELERVNRPFTGTTCRCNEAAQMPVSAAGDTAVPGMSFNTDINTDADMETGDDVTSMIAREGSELAQRLRDNGWVARAGWRSSDASGRPVWHLRFEQPTLITTEGA